jgi:predicted MFS family arabinose efflux permease
MGKTLAIIGLVIALVGVAMMAGVPLGRLPGDFTIRRGAFTFYFPLASSILVSVLLTGVLYLLRR